MCTFVHDLTIVFVLSLHSYQIGLTLMETPLNIKARQRGYTRTWTTYFNGRQKEKLTKGQ